MEAQSGGCSSTAGGSGGGSGLQVRRIHIIYFLSRKGRIEHPHLIRVHHLSRNGVRLHDVKRWLSELRGKDMPEAFAWSYKRRYKTGYVWQDLLDEDLITPISDNEYVLKGSEIPFVNLDVRSNGEKKLNSLQKEPKPEQPEGVQERPKTSTDAAAGAGAKPPCEIEEESPPFGSEASTVTDDSTKLEEEKNSILGSTKQETPKQRDDSSEKTNRKNPRKMKDSNDINSNVEINSRTSGASSASSFGKSKSYSTGAANVLRNLITCGTVDTNDSALVIIKRRDKKSFHLPIDKADDDVDDDCYKTSKIGEGDKMGGSERIFKSSWNPQLPTYPNRKSCEGVKSWDNNKSEFSNQKQVSATYKPLNGPNCSQCGKMFKPEKMLAHMKSCRGMKSFVSRKSSTTAVVATTTTTRSMDTSCRESLSDSGYFLTNSSL